jgi:hypothetical protein
MLHILVLLFVFPCFIWPKVGGAIFCSLSLLFASWIIFLNVTAKPKVNTIWADYEFELLKKYHMFFRYPMAARQFSSISSFMQMFSFIISVWFVYKKLFVLAAICFINIFILSKIAKILNPLFFLRFGQDPVDNPEKLILSTAIDEMLKKMHQIGENGKG